MFLYNDVLYDDGKTKSPINKPKKIVNVAVTQVKNKLNQKLAMVKNGIDPIFINDKSDDVKFELMKDPNRHAIIFTPNQYGLPLSDPPMYVIDENFDPEWVPPPEDEVERNWE